MYGWLIAIVSVLFVKSDREPITAAYKHPFYISVTEINHNSKEKLLEISCKIFADDFEAVLTKTSGAKVNISANSNKANNDKLISAYLTKHLQLKIDDKAVSLQFVGSEKEEDVVWTYFQVNNLETVKKIEIRNDVLYDLFDAETNLMHVMVNGNRQSKKVTNPESYLLFEF